MTGFLTYTDESGLEKWDWTRVLVLWVIVNSAPTWYTIYSNSRVRYNPERDEKYAPFVRLDYKHWHYWLVPFTHFFMIPRWICGWCAFWVVSIVGVLLSLGRDPKNLSQWRKTILLYTASYCSRVINICAGFFVQRRERIKFDYSKYLGPDYEYTYDKAGIHIVNHTTPLETTLSLALMWPKVGLLGKRESLAIPGMRQIVEGLDYILVGRDTKDPKEVRQAKLKEIEDRQIAAEQGLRSPLMMCPEGATTNG